MSCLRASPLLPGAVAGIVALSASACSSSDEPRRAAQKERGAGGPVAEDRRSGIEPGVVATPLEAGAAGKIDLGEQCEEELRFARCPVKGKAARNVDKLLDRAEASHEAGDFASAFACADMAADLIPDSVAAHHLRAAALASLGYHEAAQLAFAMALAIDPDDPETLAAAAHFYINVLPPRRRGVTLVGLEHARRGSARAASRRTRVHGLRARLALLEAQALNDLGRADQALPRVEEALALAPESVDAIHERGVALFNLCRFGRARADFARVLRGSPDDPYAHHYTGLILERAGRERDAEAHFDRARRLARGEIPKPVAITPEQFRSEVDAAIAALPEDARASLEGVAVEVEDVPSSDDLLAVEPPFAPTILGLFRGLPEDAESEPGSAPPRAIVLYRKNLARAVTTRADLERQIRRTLLHEIGHLRGFDDNELRRRGLD